MTGSAGQRRVPKAFLEEMLIPLPPISEQRRIAATLDQADALRKGRTKTIEALDRLPHALFAEMFGASKNKWPEKRLEEVVNPNTIVTYGIVQAGDEVPGGIPYIRTGDIIDGEISRSNLRHTDPAIAARFKRSRVAAGDIVMSIRATVGTTAIVPQALDGANLTQGTARISPGEQTNRLYLLNFLRAPTTQQWIQRQVKGVTFTEITLTRLRDLPVWLPPLDFQRDFAARVDKIQHLKIAALSHQSRLNALFDSLQHGAFNGELTSKHAERELEMAG